MVLSWVFFLALFFCPFSWFLPGKTLFSCRFVVISLGCAWFFLGKPYFPSVVLGFRRENTIFLRVLCHKTLFFLVSARENTIFLRVLCRFLRLCLVFPRENTFFLVLAREKPYFLTGSVSFP